MKIEKHIILKMVKDYLPMDLNKTYNFISNEYKNNISTNETIDFLLDDRFCRHIYSKGKNKSKICLSYIKNKKPGKPLCSRHYEIENKLYKKYKKYKSICLFSECKSYNRINGYCNKHKIPE